MKPCAFPPCDIPASTRGLCHAHYRQQLRGNELRPVRVARQGCDVDGCAYAHYARGLCRSHYAAAREGRPLVAVTTRCRVDGCEEQIHCRRLCTAHYREDVAASSSPCAFDACDRMATIRGLCGAHYHQQRQGRPLRPLRVPGAKAKPKAKRRKTKPAPKPRVLAAVPELDPYIPGTIADQLNSAHLRTLKPGHVSGIDIPLVSQTPADVLDAARRTLARMGAADLAEMLGLEAA